MELSGGEIVVQCLKDEGVEYLFGYPGGSVLHIYDALFKQDDVRHILVRHEQGATHAADGYARATGRPGVVLVTSGPGATNAVTGIATAYMDSIPMVILTGQVPTPVIGSDAFQECDTVGITRPCVKHNFLVKDVTKLAETIKKAFFIATTGRPGPVVVDIPKDITDPNVKVLYDYSQPVTLRSYNPQVKGHLGVVNVFFRDVAHLLAIALQLWFWFTPIVYPISILGERMQTLVHLNPMTDLVAGYQGILLHGAWPTWHAWLPQAILACLALAFARSLFRRLSGELADHL